MLDLQGTCPERACLRHSPAHPLGDRLSMRVFSQGYYFFPGHGLAAANNYEL